jgi:hypothetical protein
MRGTKLLERGERFSAEDLEDSGHEEEAYRWGAARYLAGLGPTRAHESFAEYRAFMSKQDASGKAR